MNNKTNMFLLAAVILVGIMGDGMAVSPTQEEFNSATRWTMANLTMEGAALPFSFVYDGKLSAKLLREWTVTREERSIDATRTEYVMKWNDARSGLSVRCVCVHYQDFPAVEWTLYFKNEGTRSTPILKQISRWTRRLCARQATSLCCAVPRAIGAHRTVSTLRNET